MSASAQEDARETHLANIILPICVLHTMFQNGDRPSATPSGRQTKKTRTQCNGRSDHLTQ